ncbi:hypothetical protein THASP1DRAFT_29853 [Thamnocephalis sphaerospora]|uniref:Uncharacterized protein n=1 Tax=Thamnocephalis sphaerospora TaxID=78915 RepID=A0A4P9XQN0_9FUNG|nr:hypothetical protein THASP1DRAFT_29853 [Thamnocephalis sphaerospora]|eukprot:RKP08338.1 hypothetical protein THASP1DRAFT_29853 [Thamnocephalis sphaerospora]
MSVRCKNESETYKLCNEQQYGLNRLSEGVQQFKIANEQGSLSAGLALRELCLKKSSAVSPVQLRVVVGWTLNGEKLEDVYFGLAVHGKENTFLSTRHGIERWFNDNTRRLRLEYDETCIDHVWSMPGSTRFKATIKFSRSEKADIELTLTDTTDTATHVLYVPVVENNQAQAKTPASPKRMGRRPFLRPAHTSISVVIEVNHPGIVLTDGQVYPGDIKTVDIPKSILVNEPGDMTFRSSSMSKFSGYVLYLLQSNSYTEDTGKNYGPAMLPNLPVFLLVGWKFRLMGANDTCAAMVQFEEDALPKAEDDKVAFLEQFVKTLAAAEHELTGYILHKGLRFQMLPHIFTQPRFELRITLAEFGRQISQQPNSQVVTNHNIGEYIGCVLLYPKCGFSCTLPEARRAIEGRMKKRDKKQGMRVVHCVENQSKALCLAQRPSKDRKEGVDIRSMHHDIEEFAVVHDGTMIMQVYEFDAVKHTSTKDEPDRKQAFLVTGNQLDIAMIAVVLCWSQRNEEESATQAVDAATVKNFILDVDAMQTFVSGGMNHQTFVDYMGHKFSIRGYRSISMPQVMCTTLEDYHCQKKDSVYEPQELKSTASLTTIGTTSETVSTGAMDLETLSGDTAIRANCFYLKSFGCKVPCLNLNISNQFQDIDLVNPHVISAGCRITGIMPSLVESQSRDKIVMNELPLEGFFGRGARIRYELVHPSDKKRLQPSQDEGRYVEVVWKAHSAGQLGAKEVYEAYVRLLSGGETAKPLAVSEHIYSKIRFGDTAPRVANIECYFDGGRRCFVGIYLGSQPTQCCQLTVLVTYSADELRTAEKEFLNDSADDNSDAASYVSWGH